MMNYEVLCNKFAGKLFKNYAKKRLALGWVTQTFKSPKVNLHFG